MEKINLNRVAVVTGGASGIGFGAARSLAERGHRVAVLDRDEDAAEAAAADLRASGHQALGVVADVTDRAALAIAVDRVHAEFGPVEIIVTAAGRSAMVPFTEMTLEQWEETLRINLTGTFNSLQAVVPDMIEGGWGRIVTISSSSAQSGAPRMSHYSASKGGVIALTKSLAVELGPLGITVNTVPPRAIDTPGLRRSPAMPDPDESLKRTAAMMPVRRAGKPEDIGAACAFLCSDEAGYITGQVISVNGGGYI